MNELFVNLIKKKKPLVQVFFRVDVFQDQLEMDEYIHAIAECLDKKKGCKGFLSHTSGTTLCIESKRNIRGAKWFIFFVPPATYLSECEAKGMKEEYGPYDYASSFFAFHMSSEKKEELRKYFVGHVLRSANEAVHWECDCPKCQQATEE